jgi:hypothetical protein
LTIENSGRCYTWRERSARWSQGWPSLLCSLFRTFRERRRPRAIGGPPCSLPSPKTPAGTPSGKPWSWGSKSASTAALSGFRGGSFSACFQRGPRPSGASRLTTSSGPGSRHHRAEAAPAPVDRDREFRDQRSRLAHKCRVSEFRRPRCPTST